MDQPRKLVAALGWVIAGCVSLGLTVMVACEDETASPGSTCSGAFCSIRCAKSEECPRGAACVDRQCTTDFDDCEDPDGDGFCTCCSAGDDCPGARFDADIHPEATEVCNGVDDNCDGFVDTSGCMVADAGVGTDNPFDMTDASAGVVQNPDGSLTLNTSERTVTDFAWPSNDREGTVSRIDTILNTEVGRYVSVLRIQGGDPAHPTSVPPVNEWNSDCNRPSRTTVDLRGNAYVANRAHQDGCSNKQGSVTKIGFYDDRLCNIDLGSCECVDRNGNGTIETSRDLDGDGSISLSSSDGEFLGYDDECVLWTVPIGASNSNARAMAIDANGYVWVGDWQGRQFFKLDPFDGQPVNPGGGGIALPVTGQPYGAVVDSKGFLYYVNTYNTGELQRIDTTTGETDSLETGNPAGGYGITVDRFDRIWMASWADAEGGGTVSRFDAAAGQWETFSGGLSGDFTGRGITATPAGTAPSGNGTVWAAFHGNGGDPTYIVGFDDVSGQVHDTVSLAQECGADRTIGVGIGTAGSVWAVNQDSDNVCRYDPTTGNVIEVPIGEAPYTYSDFTGNILRSFTAPEGSYREIVQGCYAPNEELTWTAVFWEAATPGDSWVTVEVRVADTPGALAGAPIAATATAPPSGSIDLQSLGLTGGYLLVEATLHAGSDGSRPTLFSLRVGRVCIGPPA